MASRFTLINELRELIAASSSTASASAPASAHLEVKLLEAHPNLLRDFVVPSPNATERELREVTAVLRLVAYTALKFPGVFYQGCAADVISIIGCILPFLAEPYFRGCPSVHLSKIVEILEELVVKNNSLLKQHIQELRLLPSLPSLSEINKVMQEARGLKTLQDHLKDAVGGLNHESLNVRYMVACELSQLFNARREDITALIVGEDIADFDVISSLIMALLKGCAEQSRTVVGQRLKLVCADCLGCLGALGAVDPAKFKVSGLMSGCLKDLPTYLWLTVLSQLISRICHQNADVVRIVKCIITSILREYPQQALWMMAAVSKSTVAARRDAAAEILQSAKKGCPRGSENSALFI